MQQLAPKILWVIKFKDRDSYSFAELEDLASQENPEVLHPAVDLYIPAPIGSKQKGLNVTDTIEIEALEFLQRIQKMCDEIKHTYPSRDPQKPNPPSQEDALKKAQNVNKHIKNLEQLVQRFNEIMKRLNNPPPPESF